MLSTLLVLFFYQNATAQNLEFQLESDKANLSVGDDVTITLTTKNFTEYAGVQFDIFFDNTIYEYQGGNFDLNTYTGYQVSTAAIVNNRGLNYIRVLGANPNSTNITRPDGDVFVTLGFKVIQQPTGNEVFELGCGGDFEAQGIVCEYVRAVDGAENATFSNIIAEPFTIEEEVIAEDQARFYATGGGTFNVGTEICYDFNVENFRGFSAFEGEFSWNTDSLELIEIKNAYVFESNGQTISFGDTDKDFLKFSSVSFTSSPSHDLIEPTRLFQACFRIKGAGSLIVSDDFLLFGDDLPADGSATASDFSETETEAIPEPDLVDGAAELKIGEVTARKGENICVPITINNVSEVVSATYRINFSETDLVFTEEDLSTGIASGIGVSTSNGVSRVVFFAASTAQEFSASEESLLYNLCFDAVGDAGTYPLTFDVSTRNFPEIASNSDGILSPLNLINGAVTIVEEASPLVFGTIDQTDVICNGTSTGSIDVSVSGGISPYTYVWSHLSSGDQTEDVSSLSAGNYSLTVRDAANTEINRDFTITQPTAMSIDGSTSNPAPGQSNGTITATVTGGTAPYSYSWTDGVSGAERTSLTENTYEVVVTDANNCTSSREFVLVAPLVASITVNNNASCAGTCDGAATVSAVGGAAPYQYLWSDANSQTTASVTGLCAGRYTAEVTDATGQKTIQNITITEPTALSIVSSDVVDNDASPNNTGEISINVTGGTGTLVYDWSNGSSMKDLIGLEEGTYTLTITDANGCQLRSPDYIVEKEVPAAAFTIIGVQIISDISCVGDNDGRARVLVQPTNLDYTYTWSGRTSGSTTTEINESAQLRAGEQTVTVFDMASGEQKDTTFTLNDPSLMTATFSNITSASAIGVDDGTAEVTISGGTAPYDIAWNSACGNVTVCEELQSGIVSLIITDNNGCQITPTVEIPSESANECSVVSPMLTPNGDGRNDELRFFCNVGSTNSLEVYDRWGQQVYFTEGYTNNWTGVDNTGNLLNEGTYFFIFNYQDGGTPKQFKGHFNILRAF